jgi:hypothetical protein
MNAKREVSGKEVRPHPSPLPRGEGDMVPASRPGDGATVIHQGQNFIGVAAASRGLK